MRRKKIHYGDQPSQFGHLYLPERGPAECAPLVVLVHGGYWSTEYSLVINTPVARDLAQRGAAVWNIEYRRVEETGGGWPGTGRDVVAAIRALEGPVAEQLAIDGVKVDRKNVAVVGHSAGGQLAVWAVAQTDARAGGFRIATVVPQSAVLDFTGGASDRTSVRRLMGVSFEEAPDRYAAASPACQPPFDALVAAVHTADDASVPIELSRRYVEGAAARGQRAVLYEVPGEGHDAFVDPRSAAHRQTLRVLGI
ncbi:MULTISPECIES: alpha/beta hydrolase family protein [Gordonia]|uniref:BD-FAE-like domain-containing protein n=1 Tax=Gordonia cholesterolivorans TaxID=559625 RepID=A0ABP5UAW5_9ACTN|nr:alpha/beta hydrolase [Gordonia sp. QH-12]KXT56002.1 esterase [Gordonia sp. QH-12]